MLWRTASHPARHSQSAVAPEHSAGPDGLRSLAKHTWTYSTAVQRVAALKYRARAGTGDTLWLPARSLQLPGKLQLAQVVFLDCWVPPGLAGRGSQLGRLATSGEKDAAAVCVHVRQVRKAPHALMASRKCLQATAAARTVTGELAASWQHLGSTWATACVPHQ